MQGQNPWWRSSDLSAKTTTKDRLAPSLSQPSSSAVFDTTQAAEQYVTFWTTSQRKKEILGLLWACFGLLSFLSFASYQESDLSLNSAGGSEVLNWIGPLGAYWSDLCLQCLGLVAYPCALGLLYLSWRSFLGQKLTFSMMQSASLLLILLSVGALLRLSGIGVALGYPVGGFLGTLLAEFLLQHTAQMGALLLTTFMLLSALVLAYEGFLKSLFFSLSNKFKKLFSKKATACQAATAQDMAYSPSYAFAGRLADAGDDFSADIQHRLQTQKDALEDLRHPPEQPWFQSPPPLPQHRQMALQTALRPLRGLPFTEEHTALYTSSKSALQHDEFGSAPLELHSILDPLTPMDLRADPPFTADLRTSLLSEEDLHEEDKKLSQKNKSIVYRQDVEQNLENLEEPEEDEDFEQHPQILNEALDELIEDEALYDAIEDVVEDEEDDEKSEEEEDDDEEYAAQQEPQDEHPQEAEAFEEIEEVEDLWDETLAAETLAAKHHQNKEFILPSVQLLDEEVSTRITVSDAILHVQAEKLTATLKDYGIDGFVREIRPGPVITMYEYVPAPGVKLSKIVSLADDLAMSMEAMRVRIVAPIPGKGAVGIEIPNELRETVYLKEILSHDAFKLAGSKLTLALGKDIEGKPSVADLARMPHLLVAGATGAGKSVSINAMIMSILCKATPEEVRMIMVDPKMLELSVYEGIPHLLLPVVTDPQKATLALRWAVSEMERRYELLSEVGVRNIDGYNQKMQHLYAKQQEAAAGDEKRSSKHLPYIIVIVDELADLMMVASRDVEVSIMRLAQMARAAGIHLILATQRPSVDVLTGVIKANFPTRIAFQVASRHDSRTIIDSNGAENLLGRGDMLYLASGAGGLSRVHGAYVSDEEIARVVQCLKAQGEPHYDESILATRELEDTFIEEEEPVDVMYDQAVAMVAQTQQASVSLLQRRLRIGFNRASRLVDRMEKEHVIGPADGAKPREVYVTADKL